MPPAKPTALRLLARETRRHLKAAGDLPARLEEPNLPATREAAALFRECFRTLSARAKLDSSLASAIDRAALYRSFEAFLAFRAGESGLAASALLDVWVSASQAEGLHALEGGPAEGPACASSVGQERTAEQRNLSHRWVAAPAGSSSAPERGEWLVVFHQAVEQVVTAELGGAQARTALRGLLVRLELSQDDVGRMFGVAGETIRRWERGATAIPAARRSEILAAAAGLRRLQDLFRPERLATAIRRPAELFDGESALEWILRGRIGQVADRYEAALLYQA